LERAEATGSYRTQGRPDPHHATKLVEADNLKHAKYDQLCQLLNPPLRCLPAVFSDFGGIGRELYSAIIRVQPHFQQLYEAEVEEGKSGWAARRAKQRCLQHTSVTDANGNFRILATMHHDSEWRAPAGPAPTPGTSTSTHRRPRAQAATSAGQVQSDTRLPTPPTSLPSLSLRLGVRAWASGEPGSLVLLNVVKYNNNKSQYNNKRRQKSPYPQPQARGVGVRAWASGEPGI
jgi:hypothetical protein